MHFNQDKVLRFKPLPKIDLKDVPEPLTWHVLVQPYELLEKTEGGLLLSDDEQHDFKRIHCVGKIVKMGPLCFNAPSFGGHRAYEIGDIIFFGRQNGMWMNWQGCELVLLADDRMLMKVTEEQLNLNFDGFEKNKQAYND
jgi:co-chaperonin GroES (HSP10)